MHKLFLIIIFDNGPEKFESTQINTELEALFLKKLLQSGGGEVSLRKAVNFRLFCN